VIRLQIIEWKWSYQLTANKQKVKKNESIQFNFSSESILIFIYTNFTLFCVWFSFTPAKIPLLSLSLWNSLIFIFFSLFFTSLVSKILRHPWHQYKTPKSCLHCPWETIKIKTKRNNRIALTQPDISLRQKNKSTKRRGRIINLYFRSKNLE